MKIFVLVAVAIVLLAGALSTSAQQRAGWEYHVHHTDSLGTLNAWGKDGWEVVAVYADPDNQVRVMMKRRTN